MAGFAESTLSGTSAAGTPSAATDAPRKRRRHQRRKALQRQRLAEAEAERDRLAAEQPARQHTAPQQPASPPADEPAPDPVAFGFHAQADSDLDPAPADSPTAAGPTEPRNRAATLWGAGIRADFTARQPPLPDVRSVSQDLNVTVAILDRARAAAQDARAASACEGQNPVAPPDARAGTRPWSVSAAPPDEVFITHRCAAYGRGRCPRGDDCLFSHDPPSSRPDTDARAPAPRPGGQSCRRAVSPVLDNGQSGQQPAPGESAQAFAAESATSPRSPHAPRGLYDIIAGGGPDSPAPASVATDDAAAASDAGAAPSHRAPRIRPPRPTGERLRLLAASVYASFDYGPPTAAGYFGPIPGPAALVLVTPFAADDSQDGALATSIGLPRHMPGHEEHTSVAFAFQRWRALGFALTAGFSHEGRPVPWFLSPCDPEPAWPDTGSKMSAARSRAYGRLVEAHRVVAHNQRRRGPSPGRPVPAALGTRPYFHVPPTPSPMPSTPLAETAFRSLGVHLPEFPTGTTSVSTAASIRLDSLSSWTEICRGRWLALGFAIVQARDDEWRAYPVEPCPAWPSAITRKLAAARHTGDPLARGRSGKRSSSSPRPASLRRSRDVRPRLVKSRAPGAPS